MDNFLHTQNHKHSPKSSKKRLTKEQVKVLEGSFTSNKKLELEQKLKLARLLNVPSRQVAVWYQNKRARWKSQSLELDYNALQLKLDNALAETKKMENELKWVKEELEKAREKLSKLDHGSNQIMEPTSLLSCQCFANYCNNTNSCDGSSSTNLQGDHMKVNFVEFNDDPKVLGLDDDDELMYACLMGETNLDGIDMR